jgi:DNA-binding NarL/FixJ family response regulator
MTRPITILLVDEQRVVRHAVRAYFQTLPDFEVLGETDSGEGVFALASELVPDIILLEITMSDMDGIETIRRLKHISPRTQIVVLTSSFEDTYVFPAIEAGAVSYNLKNMKMEWLADELRRVYHGELRLHPRVATLILRKIYDEKSGEQYHFLEMTKRELDVLRHIENGLSNSQVAEKFLVSETVIKKHVSNILSKVYLAGC